jgi:uncharacterized membrane protein YdjX (TVP38/TMEM64 family)
VAAGTPTSPRPPSRRAVALRLGLLVLLVGGLFAWTALGGARPSAARVREWADGFGAWGPLLYVGLSALLSCAWVPGPLLAGVAGLLFGAGLGTPVALAAASLAATLQLLIARHLAGRPVREWVAPRVRRLDAFLESRGLVAVLVLRLLPGVPYVATNYSAGLTRLRARDMAAGTALGAAPKTYAYVALGGTLGDLGRPEARVAVALLVGFAILGIWLGRRELWRERGRSRARGGAGAGGREGGGPAARDGAGSGAPSG